MGSWQAAATGGRVGACARPSPLLLALLVLLVAAPPPPRPRPPPNDARTAAQALTIPANVAGTTVDATLDEDEPPGCAAAATASVWYSFSVGGARQILVALDAGGDMDATVEVFERTRSQLSPLGCQNTNRRGEATLDLDARARTPRT